jgi:hypothetical protein
VSGPGAHPSSTGPANSAVAKHDPDQRVVAIERLQARTQDDILCPCFDGEVTGCLILLLGFAALCL